MMWLKRHWRFVLVVVALCAVVAIVVTQRHELLDVLRTLRTANPFWIVGALLVQSLVYLCFASVYHRSLALLGYHVPIRSLYGVAFVGVFLGRVFPAGGTSTFAFLLYQLRRRGIPDGTGAVTVTLDGLSYLIAFFVLLTGGFVYLFTHDELRVNQVILVAVISLAIITLGMYVWGLSHDRALLTKRALSLKNSLARVFRRDWSDTRVLAFIAELYEGGALIGRNRSGFVQLVGLHLTALLFDCITLLILFWSIGETPHFSVALLGYALAYFFSTVSSLPGGGGAFEATMTITLTRLGIDAPLAISVTLLYRLLAFWMPLIVSTIIYRRVHNHRGTPPQRNATLPGSPSQEPPARA